ncbi:putative transmembrane protein [Toxoplasma gondii MAS]|uniref:Putative transmembrane protein n=1 Tax=Toxoplasma gondii MAS TaxID=943118 RepID=A0A086QVF3_TOXGO|nr:putative transmembrane protein [Toxoplasma gondii MAS]
MGIVGKALLKNGLPVASVLVTGHVPMAGESKFRRDLPSAVTLLLVTIEFLVSTSPFFASCLPTYMAHGVSRTLSRNTLLDSHAVRQPAGHQGHEHGRFWSVAYPHGWPWDELSEGPQLRVSSRLRRLPHTYKTVVQNPPSTEPSATRPRPAGHKRGNHSPSFLRLRNDSENEHVDSTQVAGEGSREDPWSSFNTASELREDGDGNLLLLRKPHSYTSSEEMSDMVPEAGVDGEPDASGDIPADQQGGEDKQDEGGLSSAKPMVLPVPEAAGGNSVSTDTLPSRTEETGLSWPDVGREALRGSSAYGTQQSPSEEESHGVKPGFNESQDVTGSSATGEFADRALLGGPERSNETYSAQETETTGEGPDSERDSGLAKRNILAEDDTALGAVPVLFPQDMAVPDFETDGFVVPGNITVSLYHKVLAESIDASRRANGGRLPVIHVRWHPQESFVESAAQIFNDEGKPYFYVVAGEYTQTPIRRMGFFQTSSVTSVGPLQWPIPKGENGKDTRECPFFLPHLDQLIDSSLNITSASASTFTKTDADDTEDSKREIENLLLRWIPYGLTRIVEHGAQADTLSDGRNHVHVIRTVREFVTALQQKMPESPVKTVDGRDVVVVVNDRRPELELLLERAMDFAPSGTPVIVTDTEAFVPENILPRIRSRSRAGERIHFVVFGIGRYGQLPLNAAFLDRAVLRVPRATDIDAFVQRHSDSSPPEEKSLPKRNSPDDKEESFLPDEEPFAADNFLILNPFTEFLMRFNYTEVDNVAGYAEALTRELQHVPITFFYRNETRRVAVVLLTDFPEAESVFLTSLLKLNVIVQVTIAVAMIIGLLACLCMCRMMYLLKSR